MSKAAFIKHIKWQKRGSGHPKRIVGSQGIYPHAAQGILVWCTAKKLIIEKKRKCAYHVVVQVEKS